MGSLHRKERVIAARVPEALDDEIRRHATSLGLSVSNLVRNMLQNSLGLVGDIVAEGAEIARLARGVRQPRPRLSAGAPAQGGRVIGWQEVRLAGNAVCEVCNAVLPRGGRAAVGVLEGAGTLPLRCEKCIDGAPAEELHAG
ncbi:MAG TPA: hypothetical protein DEP35_04990 [Deltaproteobacteria bacterium]|nr:hypothetical protein [Deltaproteobacteria bacterium]